MDSNIKRSIILENYQDANNRGIPDKDGYIKINSNNVSCIDNIDIYVLLNGDLIEDIKFEGEACVIAISSTSILSEKLKGKTLKEAKEILDNYFNMIEEKEYDSNLLNNKVIFILEDKYKNVSYEEVFFPKSSFYHLTGTIIKDARGNELNSYDVYNKIIDNKLTLNRYTIKSKDKTTWLKLNVLPQLMTNSMKKYWSINAKT